MRRRKGRQRIQLLHRAIHVTNFPRLEDVMWLGGWEMNARKVSPDSRKPCRMGWKKYIGGFLLALCSASVALAGELQVPAPEQSASVIEPAPSAGPPAIA